MAVATANVFAQPVRELVVDLRELIESGMHGTVKGLVEEITEAAERVVAAGDVSEIVTYRERLHRVIKGIADLAERPAGSYALGAMEATSHQLALARTRALGRRAAERYEQEAKGVRQTVFDRLAEPARPRDLAEALGCDPSQISRAISDLTASGRIAKTDPPHGAAEDRRANWYIQSVAA